MDTDELSNELYEAIFVEADNFNPDLTLQFGLIADSCENETEYVREAKKLIAEIRTLGNADLDDMFFGSPPNRTKLLATLDKILVNISKVEEIPEKDRHYDF